MNAARLFRSFNLSRPFEQVRRWRVDKLFSSTIASRTIKDAAGNPLSLELTLNAEQKLSKLLKEEKEFLRVTVDSGGCHGFQYNFKIDNAMLPDDIEFRRGIARLVVDEISLPFIGGSKIDFVEELIGSSFQIVDNPHATTGCGCGASFDYKPIEKE